jgi:hypothetical protein
VLAYMPSASRMWIALVILAPIIILTRGRPEPEPVATVVIPQEWQLPPGVRVGGLKIDRIE